MRIYLPVAWTQLSELAGGAVTVALGHAVTDRLRAELADSGEENLEYAALTAAAADAIELVSDLYPRRVVLAVEAAGNPTGRLSEVALGQPITLGDVAAVHVDDDGARESVLAAAASPADESLVERALDHELGWYAVQELDELLG